MELVNKTARRIRIAHRSNGPPKILAPFARMSTTPSAVRELDVDPWIALRFLSVERPLERDRPRLDLFLLAALPVALASGLVVYATAPNGFSLHQLAWLTLVLTTMLTAFLWAVPLLRQYIPGLQSIGDFGDARDFIFRTSGILTVMLTGFGLPALAAWLQCNPQGSISALIQHMLSASSSNAALRGTALLVLYATFVGSAATLPALLFFLFSELRRDVAKEQYRRDLLRLDPSLRNLEEVDTKYAAHLDEALSARKGPLFFVPVITSTFLLSLGWVLATLPSMHVMAQVFGTNIATPVEVHKFLIPNREPFTFAFFGAYFFSLNMVFRRYVRADLGPKAYSHIAVRIIVASIFAWVISQTYPELGAPPVPLATDKAGEALAQSPWHLLLLVFFVGIVPDTGVAFLHDLLKNRWVGAIVPSLKNRDPLNVLEGITLYDTARLLEEGVENVENLAHHNLTDLLLRTRIPASRLVDLVDQAILYLHTREDASESESGGALLGRLKANGVRTASDLLAAAARDAEGLESIATPTRIRLIVAAIEDDEWMPQIRSWRGLNATYGLVCDLNDVCTDVDRHGSTRLPHAQVTPTQRRPSPEPTTLPATEPATQPTDPPVSTSGRFSARGATGLQR
ncbi:MAG TPA: hypothetical protein VFQ61_12555 [Polyangiaceae bacterium]|nr:hypothetical protein [Polyangiaceae bacterium]